MVVLAGAVLTAALGVDTTQSVAYQAFGFLAALMLVAMLCLAALRTQKSRLPPRSNQDPQPPLDR